VEPLERALAGLDAWIAGLRRDQAETRTAVRKVEIDEAHGGIVKINPLADWTWEEIWSYIRAHDIPYNALHDLGYPSIGCAPCTRAVAPGEDQRAGRWWWEEDRAATECGLHPGRGQGIGARRDRELGAGVRMAFTLLRGLTWSAGRAVEAASESIVRLLDDPCRAPATPAERRAVALLAREEAVALRTARRDWWRGICIA
jgi:hypothetical protein